MSTPSHQLSDLTTESERSFSSYIRSDRMNALLVCSLFLLSLVALRASSAPIEQPTFKILSLHSARFMSVTPNGDVHAKAGDSSDPSTNFYQHTRSFPKVSYESFQNPGKFLILDDKTGQLRVEEPQEDNEVFLQIAHPTHYGFYALKSHVSSDCYVAFDVHGSVSTDPHICDDATLHGGHGLYTTIQIFQM